MMFHPSLLIADTAWKFLIVSGILDLDGSSIIVARSQPQLDVALPTQQFRVRATRTRGAWYGMTEYERSG